MSNCKQCNRPLVTASYQGFLDFLPDSEPYESGKREEVDFDIAEDVTIDILWCPEHGIQSANLNIDESKIIWSN